MEWLQTKMVTVLMGMHSMYHLMPHQHTPHLYRLGVQAAIHFAELPKERYVQLGDINIGVLSAMTYSKKLSNGEDVCTKEPDRKSEAEAVAFAVQEINNGDLLPNNTKLGFVVMNTCNSKQINVASTASFLPRTECPKDRSNDEGCKDAYDVVAVVGSSRSDLSISTTRLLMSAEIPVVSAYATSDELSNTNQFPYFLRVVAPDRFQFRAIAELIKSNGWTYVSVVYEKSSFGENGFLRLSDFLNEFDICLDTVSVLEYGSNEEVQSIAQRLIEKHAQVQVVVLIASFTLAKKMVSATQRLSPQKIFAWIGTDTWSKDAWKMKMPRALANSLLLDLRTVFPVFREWFSYLKPVILCTIALMSQPQEWHNLTQPHPRRPFVSLTCTMTHAGLITFGVYNYLLLVICICLTFHTPERADVEDKLIFNCICLIIIIWLCFIPAYFLARKEMYQTMLWLLFLFLNCSAVLLLIFLPKVKAVWDGHNKVGAISKARPQTQSK